MESCKYKPVSHITVTEKQFKPENIKFLQKPFLRQLLVCSGLWMTYFVTGLITGAPTVIIPQLRKEAGSVDAVSDDMASWLTSILGVAGIPWVFIIPTLMFVIGRKRSFLIVCFNITIGFIVFYFSTNAFSILISEIVLSVTLNCCQSLSPSILSEYTSPKYRGVFLTLKSATFFWGIWVSNAIGTFFHWKNIGVLALICCSYYVLVVFYPESPYWLATKGRFDECTTAHRWLKGSDEESERELQSLIDSQICYQNTYGNQRFFCFKTVYKTLTLPEFYKPFFISIVVFLQYYSTGKLVCSLYAIDIVKKITESEDTAYKTMLILDGVTVVSMYIGCGISKYLNRRTMYLASSSIAIVFLFILSFYLYLISWNILLENNFVTISLLVLFTLSIGCGPMILCSSVFGEIVPVRYKSTMFVTLGVFLSSIYTFYLKMGPILFKVFGLHGAFFFYGVTTSFFTFILYKYLPETKDKTLNEIEENFRNT